MRVRWRWCRIPPAPRFRYGRLKNTSARRCFGEPGTLGWFELLTGDTDAAAKFYAGLVGWSVKQKDSETNGSQYIEFVKGGESVAGMMQIQPEWGQVPPNWGIYFVVVGRRRDDEAGTGAGRQAHDGPD